MTYCKCDKHLQYNYCTHSPVYKINKKYIFKKKTILNLGVEQFPLYKKGDNYFVVLLKQVSAFHNLLCFLISNSSYFEYLNHGDKYSLNSLIHTPQILLQSFTIEN